jgi:DNA-directed RNA polymerase subunit RPC12/RpoP
MKDLICPSCGSTDLVKVSDDYIMCEDCHHKDIISEFNRPPYAISTSDRHDEDWTFYQSELEAHETFIYMQGYESDIHLYKFSSEFGYEVIDSWCDGE